MDDVDQELREEMAINAVNDRLRRTFSDTHPDDVVTTTVQEVHHRFDNRPIRDFVPVLVERFAREKLRTPTSV